MKGKTRSPNSNSTDEACILNGLANDWGHRGNPEPDLETSAVAEHAYSVTASGMSRVGAGSDRPDKEIRPRDRVRLTRQQLPSPPPTVPVGSRAEIHAGGVQASSPTPSPAPSPPRRHSRSLAAGHSGCRGPDRRCVAPVPFRCQFPSSVHLRVAGRHRCSNPTGRRCSVPACLDCCWPTCPKAP